MKPLRLLLFSALALLLAIIFSWQATIAQSKAATRTVLYVAVGANLTQYDVDLQNATLDKRGSVAVPAYVHEAWVSRSKKFLYVAWSDRDDTNLSLPYSQYGVSTFRINPASGALTRLGQPAKLPYTPDYITTDVDDTHVLTTYNDPSDLTVHQILPDGTVGAEVKQPGKLDFGIYAHQVRVDPSNKTVFLVTRGNGPTATKPEDPGAITIFNYQNGMLSLRKKIAPNGGFNYQARHMDFHPSGKWVYLALERQSKIHVYRRAADGTLSDEPIFAKDTLANPTTAGDGQTVSSIHLSPNGRFLYVGNRSGRTAEFEGKRVFTGGENTLAVFSINQDTGEPTLIQNVDSRGITPRTFAIDASGSILVVGNQSSGLVRDGSSITTVPARVTVFRIQGDGKLDFAHQYDFETSGGSHLFWTGMISLP